MSSAKASHVVLDTSMGAMSVELYWQHAPRTCMNFQELARKGYYNNTIFHRIIADFMVQGGDPTRTGRGGTSIYGSRFEDEISDQLRHTGAGIISMANSGPNTNGSQFFITLGPAQHLDEDRTGDDGQQRQTDQRHQNCQGVPTQRNFVQFLIGG
uniref:Peptidyl-prolyl cis-trans isomerase n=1 Tax=Globodera rostochiensis TaxID=31243 RepID=A0A914I933_GLORO